MSPVRSTASEPPYRWDGLPDAPYYTAVTNLIEYLAAADDPQPYDIPGVPAAIREKAATEQLKLRGSQERLLRRLADTVGFIMNVDDDLESAVVANRPLDTWSTAADVHCRILGPDSGLWDFPAEVEHAFDDAGDDLVLVARLPVADTANTYSLAEIGLAATTRRHLPMMTFDGAYYEELEEFLAQCDVTFAPGTKIHLTQEADSDSCERVGSLLEAANDRRNALVLPGQIQAALRTCQYDQIPRPSDLAPATVELCRAATAARQRREAETPHHAPPQTPSAAIMLAKVGLHWMPDSRQPRRRGR